MNNTQQLLKNACWLHLSFAVNRYLMSNAHGRCDGAEKALRHIELCTFYVAVVRGVADVDLVRRYHEDDFQFVHTVTQALTDNLDTEIGFPLTSRPDYEKLAPRFFERFHALATRALGLSLGTQYAILANEPDGWLKAWQVLRDGQHAAYFRYKDSADVYVAEQLEREAQLP